MLENKIKVIERTMQHKVSSNAYIVPVFVQFVICLYLIHFFSYSISGYTLSIFLFFYFLLTLSNILLFAFKPIKLAYVFILFILSLFFKSNIIAILFAIYVIYESLYTYRNLRTISNEIFKPGKLRKPINKYIDKDNKILLDYSNFSRKLYMPHIIERLGIIMIVFLAEYVLVTMDTLHEIHSLSQFFIQSIGLFTLVITFHYNYFSSIEHIDHKLLQIKDKRLKYRIGKRSVYIVVLYFLSISSFAFFAKNLNSDTSSYLFFGFAALILFEIADLILFEIFDDIKVGKHALYLTSKLILFTIAFLALFTKNPTFILFIIDICFIANVVIGKRLTTIKYRIM